MAPLLRIHAHLESFISYLDTRDRIKVLYALAALLGRFHSLIHFDVYSFYERNIAPEELAIKLYHIWSIVPGNSFSIIFNLPYHG